ncbi:hypothetical protein WME90_12160 [Sorangium sp. So ce375]|uniref:hypothetical protein n=1 Tax=Sorangium sp. So ce375 TaxID=3133306 RepID=UPI003F5BDF1E
MPNCALFPRCANEVELEGGLCKTCSTKKLWCAICAEPFCPSRAGGVALCPTHEPERGAADIADRRAAWLAQRARQLVNAKVITLKGEAKATLLECVPRLRRRDRKNHVKELEVWARKWLAVEEDDGRPWTWAAALDALQCLIEKRVLFMSVSGAIYAHGAKSEAIWQMIHDSQTGDPDLASVGRMLVKAEREHFKKARRNLNSALDAAMNELQLPPKARALLSTRQGLHDKAMAVAGAAVVVLALAIVFWPKVVRFAGTVKGGAPPSGLRDVGPRLPCDESAPAVIERILAACMGREVHAIAPNPLHVTVPAPVGKGTGTFAFRREPGGDQVSCTWSLDVELRGTGNDEQRTVRKCIEAFGAEDRP